MPDVTVTSIRLIPSPAPARAVKGEKDTMITYTLDGKANAMVIVEGADPTEDQIKAALKAELKLQQHQGKTFKL
jgi:hypothetical protein